MSFSTSGASLGVLFTETFTVRPTEPEVPAVPFAVGTRTEGPNNSVYVFVSNATTSAFTVGQVVSISTAFAATPITSANDAIGQQLGVAVSAVPATTTSPAVSGFGWVQINGFCSAILVDASCAANVQLHTDTVAGGLRDDTIAGSHAVEGIVLTTARGGTAGTAPGWLNAPYARTAN